MVTDNELSAATARAAGQMLLELRARYGDLGGAPRETSDRLRKEADRASHELIVERISAERPDDCILSEEGKDDLVRLDADRVWIVDPLDGTWEFGQGRSDFAVHIVLWQPGRGLSASTVDLPAQGLTRTDVDAPAPASPLPIDRPIRLVASRTRPPAALPDIVARLSARLGREVEVVDVGSVGAKVNELLSGRADAYLHDTGFYEWDVAAPYAVAQQYGLHASHIDGREVEFNRASPYVEDLMVSTPALHAELVAAVREAAAG
jgi:3'(2'), 5'-bisphosphate nucleotidase